MPRAPRLLSAFLIVAALSTPAVIAKETHAKATPRPRATSGTASFSGIWVTLTHLWGMSGCGIDPNGNGCGGTAVVKPPLPTADSGCSIDPYGACGH